MLLITNQGLLTDEFATFTANLGNGKGQPCIADSGSPVLLGDTNTILAVEVLGSGNSPHCTGVERDYRLDTASAQDFINHWVSLTP